MSAQPPQRRVRRGKPLAWDDAVLDREATVTDADQDAARSWWERYAPKWARPLLDAGDPSDAPESPETR